MKNSFVAFFDVLGFKNLVEKNSHEDLIDIYEFGLYKSLDISEEYTNLIFKYITPENELDTLKVKIYVISDSVIFIQEDMSERGLLYIISYCRMLIGSALADGIPIRGGLSFGPVTIDNRRGTTVVGLGLTKAYNLESKQQWAGGIIDKECFEIVTKKTSGFLDGLINNKKNPIIAKYNVPLKDGTFNEELVFDWTIYNLIKNEDFIKQAFSKHNKEIIPEVESKIENTITFFNEMKLSHIK